MTLLLEDRRMYDFHDRPGRHGTDDVLAFARMARREAHAVMLEVAGRAAAKGSDWAVAVAVGLGQRSRVLRGAADRAVAKPPVADYWRPAPPVVGEGFDQKARAEAMSRHPAGKGLGAPE